MASVGDQLQLDPTKCSVAKTEPLWFLFEANDSSFIPKLKIRNWKISWEILVHSYGQPRQHIKMQRYYFTNKDPSSQGYGFSSSHVCMWELDCEESWMPKNWCFWTVVLGKTLESPLDCKEIQPVHPKGNQSWIFIGKTDAEAETSIHLMWRAEWFEKILMMGKTEGRRRRGHQRMRWLVGWHHWLNGHAFGWTLGVGDGQGGLVCFYSWGRKELDMTEWLNWTENGQNPKHWQHQLVVKIWSSWTVIDCWWECKMVHSHFGRQFANSSQN